MRAFNGSKVEIGHFASQKHSMTEFSYVDLMRLAHFGSNGPARKPLVILKHKNQRLDDSKFNTLMAMWGKSDYSSGANDKLLQGFGIVLGRKERELFGRTGPDMPPNSPNTRKRVGIQGSNSPLIDSGELRDGISYRTSINKTVKKV